MKIDTFTIHPFKKNLINTFMPPITKTSTVFIKNIENINKRNNNNIINYGLHGTFISKYLEKLICKIENGKYTFLTNSGLMSLFITYISILRKKDIIFIPNNIYEPNKPLLKTLSNLIKIKVIIYNPQLTLNKYTKIYNKIKKIKIIVLEIPGSITLKMPNIPAIKKLIKIKKAISIIDNTYSAGLTFKTFKNKFDISIQALTKFQSGNNDIFMGSITTQNKNITKKILKTYKICGINVCPEDCYLIIRNLNTLSLKHKTQAKNTIKIIKNIKKNIYISKIYHPKFYKKPYKNIFKKNFKYTTSIFSFKFIKNIKEKQINKFINKLKLFKIGFSWGGAISLIMKYKNKNNIIIRLSIGLENPMDLIKDLNENINKHIKTSNLKLQ